MNATHDVAEVGSSVPGLLLSLTAFCQRNSTHCASLPPLVRLLLRHRTPFGPVAVVPIVFRSYSSVRSVILSSSIANDSASERASSQACRNEARYGPVSLM